MRGSETAWFRLGDVFHREVSMSEPHYFASDEEEHRELARLAMLEGIFDPMTIRHLEKIGPTEGWTCLEVGAGAGSVARWLATRVGATGRVVATDIDTRFLARMGLPNLEIRQQDILAADAEPGLFDLNDDPDLIIYNDKQIDIAHPGGAALVRSIEQRQVMLTPTG